MNVFSAFKKCNIDYLLVGLGNPGSKYDRTRHNIGFAAIDYIGSKLNAVPKKLKFSALYEKCVIGGKNVLLMKPQTYMNNSGEAVGAAARFYKIPPERVIVIMDDVSLPCGALRVRKKGSAGGHNGLKSINQHLKSEEYPRIKIGVGEKPTPDHDLADWVLSAPSAADSEKIISRFDDIYKAVSYIVADDFNSAMNECNRTVI